MIEILNIFIFLTSFSLAEGTYTESCEHLRGTSHLKYDEALLFIRDESNSSDRKIFKAISTSCYKCDLTSCATFINNATLKMTTRFSYGFSVVGSNETVICRGQYHFGEHGQYVLTIDSKNVSCSTLKITKEPINTYLPLIGLFSTILGLVVLNILLSCIIRKHHAPKHGEGYESIRAEEDNDHIFSRSHNAMSSYGSTTPSLSHSGQHKKFLGGVTFNSPTTVLKRVKSLDTFRGISIVVMIFVNYGGGKYWFFNHSKWNGLTVADLVFPWFIFIMGSSIFISCRSMRRKSIAKKTITMKIFVRTVKLFALGLFINNGNDLAHWRIPGVLQRFAFSYFVVAFLNVWLSPEEDQVDIHYRYDWRDSLRDLTWFPLQHLVMISLLAVYMCLTFLLPVPNCPKGYLGPGGISEGGKYFNCTGGAAAYIDKKFFGINHIYGRPTCTFPYKCSAHDPEGLLGVIPSILLTYFGVMAARILFLYSKAKSHILRWMFWAIVLGCIAIVLSGGFQNDGLIPINKNLWSLSFICATGSMAFLLLTLCYIIIDVKQIWSGVPFQYAGMNSIMLYCGHEVLAGYFPFSFKDNGQHDELLTQASVGTFVWLVIAFSCFKYNVFWKV